MTRTILTRLHDARLRWAAWGTLAGLAEVVLAVVALNLLVGVPWHMSEFANSSLNWLWVVALATLLASGALVAWAAAPVLPRHPLSAVGLLLLGISGIGGLAILLFPVDASAQSTLVGAVHNGATIPTFLALGLAFWALGSAFRASPLWASLAPSSRWIGRGVLAAGLLVMVADRQGAAWVAVAQRVLIGLVALWFALAAWRLLELTALASRRAVRRRERRGQEPPRA